MTTLTNPIAQIHPATDFNEIRRALHLIVPFGQVFEIRALDASLQGERYIGTVSGYFDSAEAATQAIRKLTSATGVYVTLNPVDPALLARAKNRLHMCRRDDPTTGDANIMRRRSLLVDVDPKRPTGISATDAERAAAIALVRTIRQTLAAEGWPEPILADSGNGGHLLYRIDLPADDGGLVERCLKAIAFKFGTSKLDVDTKVGNPSRITKLYGTVACKGDHTAERPHRLAHLLEVPETRQVVPIECLQALAASVPSPAKTTAQTLTGDKQFDLDRWMNTYCPEAEGPVDWSGGRKWIFPICPWNPEHTNRSAYVVQRTDGAIGAGCHHNGCADNDWHSLRATREPGWQRPSERASHAPAAPGQATDADDSAEAGGEEAAIVPLGERDPSTGRLVLSPAKTLPTAEAFVRQFYMHDQSPTIHNYVVKLMVWRGNRYVEVEDEQIRHALQPWLHGASKHQFDKKTGTFELVDFDSNPRTIDSALRSIRTYTHVRAEITPTAWLDGGKGRPDPRNILAFPSGILDLATGQVLPPTPALFNTAAIDFDYCPNPKPPKLWNAFLKQLFGDDLESVQLLQEWAGYSLVADTSQQKMLMIVGPKRSGKGTLARILTSLVGAGTVVGPTTGSLAGQFGLQPLIGKSLAIVSDARFAGEKVAILVERLLCISGEDTLTIDRKFLPSVTMRLPTRFMFLTNELPRMNDASGALANRFLILRLIQSFFGQEDPMLTQKLLQELPGILCWAIDGLKRLRDRGHFAQPRSVADAVQDLEDLGSSVGAFVRECCEVGLGRRACVGELYEAWRKWCEADGRNLVINKQTFGRDLSAAVPGIVCRKNSTAGTRFYDGIGLRYGGAV